MQKVSKRKLTAAILSVSLLTVMAGAAVAPALGIIGKHFAEESPLLIQMIISVPALFIILTGFVFPMLCRMFGGRALILSGLLLYIVGGCGAGCFSDIVPLLLFRALVGIGVGILMPLSTGLLTFYFPPEDMEKLMGYSSAMNQMGGAVATLLAGVLATLSWRASFLVYALGIPCFILCYASLPNDRLAKGKSGTSPSQLRVLHENFHFIAAMFLLMLTFFFYPANFAMVAARQGVIPIGFVALIMASMDIVAFFGGLAFAALKRSVGDKMRFLAPALFVAGYLILSFTTEIVSAAVGSFCIGFANGAGIPYIIAAASRKAGKAAATTIMPLLSMALYIGQFAAPILLSLVVSVTGISPVCLPYYLAVITGIAFLFVSKKII